MQANRHMLGWPRTKTSVCNYIVLLEFWRHKLFMSTVKGLVELDQHFDLPRLRDLQLDCFDRCEYIKFFAVFLPKCKMKVSDSVDGMLRTSRQFDRLLACFTFICFRMCSFSIWINEFMYFEYFDCFHIKRQSDVILLKIVCFFFAGRWIWFWLRTWTRRKYQFNTEKTNTVY